MIVVTISTVEFVVEHLSISFPTSAVSQCLKQHESVNFAGVSTPTPPHIIHGVFRMVEQIFN